MGKYSNIQVLASGLANGDIPVNLIDAVKRAVESGSTTELATLSLEAQHNLFLSAVYNKFGKQVILDVLGNWTDELTRLFLRDASTNGEFTEILGVNNDPSKNMRKYQLDDENGNNPFGIYKAEVLSEVIKIENERQWVQTITRAEMRKAFINEYGLLDTLESLIVGSINKKADIFLYNITKEYLAKIKLNLVVGKVEDEASGKKAFKTILTACNSFSRPTTKFNEVGVYSTTQKEDINLIITDEDKASFDVDVMASLFNSGYIALNNKVGKYINADVNEYDSFEITITEDKEEIITTTHHVDNNIIGYLVDKDKLRLEMFLIDTMAIVNPKNLTTNYWHTIMQKCGIVSFVNGLKLIVKPTTPTLKTIDGKVYALSTDVNVKLYYTTNGDTPTKDDAEYTTPLTSAQAVGLKVVAYCKDTNTYSDVVANA